MLGMTDYLTPHKDGFTLRIRLTPGASRENVGDVYTDETAQEWLKASVTVVPEKGRANKALIALLSKHLKIRKSAFTLTSGETDRHKIFAVSEKCDADLITRIRQCARPSAS